MESYTDWKEFARPEGKKVRVVFEFDGLEVLFHYCEFQHTADGAWKNMTREDDGYCTYSVVNEDGTAGEARVQFPTFEEIADARDEIYKKYNILSV